MTERRTPTESELVELIRSNDVRAPDSLHRKVDAMIAERTRGPARAPGAARRGSSVDGRRTFELGPRIAAGGAFAVALIALAIVIGLSGGGSTLSLRDASALTLRSATDKAPSESASDHRELTAAVDGVTFPYWGGHFGWRTTGTRSDRVDGREITTVFYENKRGQRVGYAIAAGKAPPQSGGIVSVKDGTPYRLLTVGGVEVVSWLRDGRLCVVSGHGVKGATLLRLASWDDRAVAS
jgi:hypothetical protein